jgi:O-antigen/teichoic acid export membrane protein
LAIIDSFRPVIFESKKRDYRAFEQNMSLLYSVVIYLGLAESVALTVLAHPVVSILYGKDYLPAVPILQILVWYTAFSYMGSVRNIWMLAEGKQKYLWIINLSGASLNVIGNFILIPILGAAGAALASVATQIFANYVLCIVMKPIRPTAGLIWSSLNPKRQLYVLKNFQK